MSSVRTRKTYVAFAAFVCSLAAAGQALAVPLTGTKNIPGDYATLAAAIADLNLEGVGAGGVTLNLLAGNPETAPAGGYVIGGTGSAVLTSSSVTNTIAVQGNGNIITASGALTAGALNDAIFKLVGADFVTISGFTMQENSGNTTTTAASNNMTEWGVALIYVTTADGAQNNTIQNNTITLNRTYQNTFGIYSNSTHSATAPTTAATATTTAGGNSGLRIYGNNISNVNLGIVVVGPTAAADHNTGVDIGGASAPTGNTITNYGTTGTFSSYANVSGTVYGILVRNSIGFNISFNNITSSSGAGGVVAGTMRGIYVPSASNQPVGTFTNNINNNTLAVNSHVVTGTLQGITVETTTSSPTSSTNVDNNNITSLTHTIAAASGTIIAISHTGSTTAGPLNHSISNNTFTNLTATTTGSFTFISNNWTRPTNGVGNVNNNSIVGAFSKTGAGGSVILYTSNSTSGATVTEFNNGNNFSNLTVTGATAVTGWRTTDGGSLVKTVTGNTFSNWTGGTSQLTGLAVSFSGSANVSGNLVSNLAGAGAIVGMETSSGTQTFSQNVVHSLTGSGTGAVTGMTITGGTTQTLFKNRIYDLSNTNAGGAVNGILITGATTRNINNNLIGGLTAPSASGTDVIRGISSTSTTTLSTIDLAYNSIYINAVSSGANFGTSGVFHTASTTATTAALTMRSNVIVNTSTPAGTGLTVAFRRSAGTAGMLANYGSASNNNDLYAGIPGPANLIYSDGTSTAQTLASYKTGVFTAGTIAPRDSASVTENPPFLSTAGANANFLHIDTSIGTILESGGINVAGITDDFDADIRQGNVGYVGTGSAPDIGADEFNGIGLPPANDTCGLAQVLTPPIVGTPTIVGANNQFATLDGPSLTASCTPNVTVDHDVWYSLTPTVTDSYRFSTCGSTFDTVIELFDICGGTSLACNDDLGGACGTGSQFDINLTATTTYLLRVCSKSPGGAFTLTVSLTPLVNDECSGALAITTGVTPIIMVDATTTTTPAPCSSITKDVWYAFTASCAGTLTVTNCGQAPVGYDTVIAIYSGACPSGLTQLVCNDGGGACGLSEASASASVGAGVHFIRVGTFGTTPSADTSLDVSFVTNDICASASALTVGAAAVSGSFSCASFEGNGSTCDPTGVDLWYSVTLASALPGNVALTIDTCGSASDTVLSVYTGPCGGPPVEIACNDECGGTPCGASSSCVSLYGPGAGTYLIRVSDKGTSGGGSFQIKASVALANDTCASAITVTCGTGSTGTTVGSTPDTVPDCTSVAPSIANVGGNSAVTAGGVWYKIIGDGQTVTADTLIASFDSKLSVYTGPDCSTLTCVTMNDDIRADFHSKVAFTTVPLQQYWILVHGFGTATGTFTLNVTCAPTPTNNDCASASSIGGASGTIPGTIVGATAEAFTPNSSVLASCATNANHPLFDVWYALTACSTGTLTLDTCGGYDTLLSVHSTCPTLTLGNQIAAACNDNGPVGCTPGSQLTLAVTQGSIYLIRVAGNIGQNVGQPFLLTWSLPDSTLPVISTCAPDQTVTADVNCDATVPDFTAGVSATDNCGIASITQSPLAGTTVNGAIPHVILLTVTDTSNNTATCNATLFVQSPLSISLHPQNVVGCVDGSASFSVTAAGVTGYQWRHNTNPLSDGGNISGSNTSTLTINPLSAADAGVYDVVLSNGCGSQNSNPASLTVNSTPTIVTQPVGGTVGYGTPFAFTVGASGGGLSYQWYREGVPLVDGGTISGATTANLSISSTVREDSGTYTVVVTNNCGTITSEPAYLEVNGNATVSLVSPPCVNSNQLVVDVLMTSSTSVVVGGQFFLAYDNLVLDFVSADPGDAPFITEVYEIVNEPAGEINYAVGIDDEGGTGTSANTVMARLTFNILQNVCTLTPHLVSWRASGPNGAESKLSNSMGLQVNINPVNLGNVRLDNVAPVITVCPSNISVHADPGSCNSAPVTYAAAASDNCTGSPTITFNPPSGSTFGPGSTPVLVTATDECGNSSTCTFNVINDGMVEISAEVELGGGAMANGTFNRAITFALWNTGVNMLAPLHTTCVNMSFSGNFPAPKLGTATFLVPCQPTGYDCITARDRLHTLRRTISPIPVVGPAYAPSFTGVKALIGGNLDDSKFIDILDFGIYTTQDLTLAPGGANTVCGQNPPGFLHADITGNGVVNSLDYSFIANNFLMAREPNCNGDPNSVIATNNGGRSRGRADEQPVTSITIGELADRGLSSLAVMDLNQDGVFDLADKALWDQGVRPSTAGGTAPAGGSLKPSQNQNLGTGAIPVP